MWMSESENSETSAAMPLNEWHGLSATVFGHHLSRTEVMAYATRMGYDPVTGRGKASMAHGGAFEAVISDGATVHLYWEPA